MITRDMARDFIINLGYGGCMQESFITKSDGHRLDHDHNIYFSTNKDKSFNNAWMLVKKNKPSSTNSYHCEYAEVFIEFCQKPYGSEYQGLDEIIGEEVGGGGVIAVSYHHGDRNGVLMDWVSVCYCAKQLDGRYYIHNATESEENKDHPIIVFARGQLSLFIEFFKSNILNFSQTK